MKVKTISDFNELCKTAGLPDSLWEDLLAETGLDNENIIPMKTMELIPQKLREELQHDEFSSEEIADIESLISFSEKVIAICLQRKLTHITDGI